MSAFRKDDVARWGHNLDETIELEDWSSEWKEVLAGNGVWGGRTRGGRGVQKITGLTRDISVEGVTLSFCGKELLQRTTLKLCEGHRYALVGENGVGKSTLLRRIACQSLPGIPLHFKFGYVQQELALNSDDAKMPVLEYIFRSFSSGDKNINPELALDELKREETRLESLMESCTDNDEIASMAEQLCSIVDQIDEIEAKLSKASLTANTSPSVATKEITRSYLETLGKDVINILDGLGLSKPIKRLSMKMSELSGGWRMRAALAQCLCNLITIDVLLLDEPTNHLDLPTVAWLEEYLKQTGVIILFVSHDRSFMAGTATDIIEMKDLSLHYFSGGYEDWNIHLAEMSARVQNAVDARVRKESHIQKSIDAAHARGDDKMAKAKGKKLERAAFTKAIDGHRFKLFSLAKLDESAVHMPDHIEADRSKDFRLYKFKFPATDASILRLPTPTSPLLTMEKVSLTYKGREKPVLEEVSLQLTLQSRVGILGRNGRGKSTLLSALYNAIEILPNVRSKDKATSTKSAISKATPVIPANVDEAAVLAVAGTIWRHHNLRVGVVAQHQIDVLSDHCDITPVDYIRSSFIEHQASTGTEEKDHEIRAHLGAFGLSGKLALQKIGSLSGGQKARLSFAAVCASKPHLLLLDEPSNHLSIEAVDGLISACREFSGGIVLVSHNRHLLSKVCNELFIVTSGKMTVRKPMLSSKQENNTTTSSHFDYSEESCSAFEELLSVAISEQMKG